MAAFTNLLCQICATEHDPHGGTELTTWKDGGYG